MTQRLSKQHFFNFNGKNKAELSKSVFCIHKGLAIINIPYVLLLYVIYQQTHIYTVQYIYIYFYVKYTL